MFTNRDHEWDLLEVIHAEASAGSRPAVVVITGPGGVGKSALALRWLHTHRNRFPDGQLYVHLGGVSQPVDPGEVLAGFLRALGAAPGDIPVGVAERTALYRSLTYGKALAVLTDDASCAAQVCPLLPATAGCVMVITSRTSLTALFDQGARSVPLQPLAEREAVCLLSQALGAGRVAAEAVPAADLAGLCGGLPVALLVSAAQLADRPHHPIAALVTTLRGTGRLAAFAYPGERSVLDIFDESYHQLSSDAARLYRLVGLHPGPHFDHTLAAAALHLSPDAVDAPLQELLTAHLLTEPHPDRYRFHDLLGEHARHRAEADDTIESRTAALRRMAEHYLDHATDTDLVVMPHRDRIGPRYALAATRPAPVATIGDALAWLEDQLPNLVAIQLTMADHDWHDLVWQLAEALWGLLLLRKHYHPWLTTHQLAITSARRCGDRVAEARMNLQLGVAYLNIEQLSDAHEHFNTALTLSRAAQNRQTEASAVEHLGIVAQARGDLTQAHHDYTYALALNEAVNRPRGVAILARRLGEIYRATGEPDQALRSFDRAVKIATELGDTILATRFQAILAATHTQLGDPDTAIALLNAALPPLREMGTEHYVAEALETLADAHLAAGRPETARTHLTEAAGIYTRINPRRANRVTARLTNLTQDTE